SFRAGAFLDHHSAQKRIERQPVVSIGARFSADVCFELDAPILQINHDNRSHHHRRWFIRLRNMRQRETVKDRISGQRTKADLLPCALHFQLIPTECPMTKILGAPLSPLCSGGCRPRLNMPIEFTTESGRSGGTVLAENVTRRMAIRRTDSP